MSYKFTPNQLVQLLADTVKLMIECRDKHGKSETEAINTAILSTIEGLDAEQELAEAGECRGTMQTLQGETE